MRVKVCILKSYYVSPILFLVLIQHGPQIMSKYFLLYFWSIDLLEVIQGITLPSVIFHVCTIYSNFRVLKSFIDDNTAKTRHESLYCAPSWKMKVFYFHSVKRCSLDVYCSPCCTYYVLHGRSFPGDGRLPATGMAEPEEKGQGGKLEGKRMSISNRTYLNHEGRQIMPPTLLIFPPNFQTFRHP